MHRVGAVMRAFATSRTAGPSQAAPLRSKAIVFSKTGPPEKVLCVQWIPLPPLGPKSVLVKILAAPVNPADVNVIQGTYPVQPNWKEGYGAVGGNEGVCEVLSKGDDVTDLHPGDWVIPLTRNVGTWQTHAVADSSDFLKLPNTEGVSPMIAATVSVNPSTAYRMLKDFVDLKPGDVVIQNSANSSVGQAVIQLARAWGIKTVNIIRHRSKVEDLMEQLKKLGADLVITEEQMRTPETAKRIAALGYAPRLGLNGVGGKSATNMARLLGNGGHLVTYGGMSKEPVTLPTSLFIFKNIKCSGFWMNQWYLNHTLSDRVRIYSEVFELARMGKFVEPFYERVSLNERSDDELVRVVSGSLGGFVGGKPMMMP